MKKASKKEKLLSKEDVSFVKYYKDGLEVNITMGEIKQFIDDKNKRAIAESVYQRLYSRYLKTFDFPDPIFKEQYKSGFLIMAGCSLVIETLGKFLKGRNKRGYFITVFEYAKTNGNKLEIFLPIVEEFMDKIRNSLLHSGETEYFRISRSSETLYNPDTRTINATAFLKELIDLLRIYQNNLETTLDFESDIWKRCVEQIGSIIANTE